MAGWIKLHRDIKNHWVYENDVFFKRWIDILITVNHCENKVLIKNTLLLCGRGQSVKSLESWSKDWNTSKKTVSNFFKLLQKDNMIIVENLKITTRITVCNYDTYNDEVNAKETLSKHKGNAKETLSKHKGNDTFPQTRMNKNELIMNKNEKEKNENSFFEKNSDFENSDLKNYDEIKLQEEIKAELWRTIKNEIWNSHTYLNDLSMKSEEVFGKKMTYAEIRAKLKEFGNLLNLRGECKETAKEFKIHLVNWIKSEVAKELKNPNKKSVSENYNEIKTALAKKYENYSDNQIFIKKL